MPGAATAAFDRLGRTAEALSWRAFGAALVALRWREAFIKVSEAFVLPSELRAALVRILAYLAAIFSLSIIGAELFKERAIVFPREPIPRPSWAETDNPRPAFQFAAPGMSDEMRYAIKRHVEGGGRKDTITFGELGKTRQFISLEIYRLGREVAAFPAAPEAMRIIAAEHGRVLGLRGSMPVPSKFGPFAAFEFAVGPFGSYQCVGFLQTFDGARVQIGGLACNMNLIVDRSAISCALDRLDLLSAGNDPGIARIFAHAEMKRTFCRQRDPLLHASTRRPVADEASSVKLRGRLAP